MRLRWVSRNENAEANALTNEEFSGLVEENRVSAEGMYQKRICLPRLVAAGAQLEAELKDRGSRRAHGAEIAGKRKQPEC